MADIQKLFATILSDTKPVGSDASTPKVYRDEPILMTTTQLERLPPSKYRGMRMLARNLHNASASRIFYAQARFMQDFEDDFVYEGEFSRYYPTYQGMSNLQLRGYFSWRTKVRRGVIEPTSRSFAFVYIYELLNGIGVCSPLEGFYALKDFCNFYRDIDAEIDGYAGQWLSDYAVYHCLDKSLLAGLVDMSFDDAMLTLLEHMVNDPATVFAALNGLSSYNLAHSRFFKQHAADVQNVTCAVFAALSYYYAQNHQSGLCENLFGKVYVSAYYMFRGAVFYQLAKPKDGVYEVNSVYKYRCQNGAWTCERFFGYRGKNRQVGALLKTLDFLMRRQYGFKSSLKPGDVPKDWYDIIVREIERYRTIQKQAAAPKIEIDVARLPDIRHTALVTQGKLLTDAEVETKMPPVSVASVVTSHDTVLDDTEYHFMQCLLYGRAYDEFLRVGGLLTSVLADAVNTRLFDLFGDTVLMDEGDGPFVLTDYIDELKGMIKP